jgi:hypothetical protein
MTASERDTSAAQDVRTTRDLPPPSYAELCVTSNFTFLTGASHPEELVTRAAELGLEAIADTGQTPRTQGGMPS